MISSTKGKRSRESSRIIDYYHNDIMERGINIRGSQIALLKVAESSLDKGEYESAIDLYERITKLSRVTDPLKILVAENIVSIRNYLHLKKDTYRKNKTSKRSSRKNEDDDLLDAPSKDRDYDFLDSEYEFEDDDDEVAIVDPNARNKDKKTRSFDRLEGESEESQSRIVISAEGAQKIENASKGETQLMLVDQPLKNLVQDISSNIELLLDKKLGSGLLLKHPEESRVEIDIKADGPSLFPDHLSGVEKDLEDYLHSQTHTDVSPDEAVRAPTDEDKSVVETEQKKGYVEGGFLNNIQIIQSDQNDAMPTYTYTKSLRAPKEASQDEAPSHSTDWGESDLNVPPFPVERRKDGIDPITENVFIRLNQLETEVHKLDERVASDLDEYESFLRQSSLAQQFSRKKTSPYRRLLDLPEEETSPEPIDFDDWIESGKTLPGMDEPIDIPKALPGTEGNRVSRKELDDIRLDSDFFDRIAHFKSDEMEGNIDAILRTTLADLQLRQKQREDSHQLLGAIKDIKEHLTSERQSRVDSLSAELDQLKAITGSKPDIEDFDSLISEAYDSPKAIPDSSSMDRGKEKPPVDTLDPITSSLEAPSPISTQPELVEKPIPSATADQASFPVSLPDSKTGEKVDVSSLNIKELIQESLKDLLTEEENIGASLVSQIKELISHETSKMAAPQLPTLIEKRLEKGKKSRTEETAEAAPERKMDDTTEYAGDSTISQEPIKILHPSFVDEVVKPADAAKEDRTTQQPTYSPAQQIFYPYTAPPAYQDEPEPDQNFFQADEEVVVKDVKESKRPRKDVYKYGLQDEHVPDLVVEQADVERDFLRLEDIDENSFLYDSLESYDSLLSEERLSLNHPDIDPTFIPQAYVPYEEFTNRNGFFINEEGEPIEVIDPDADEDENRVEESIVTFDENRLDQQKTDTNEKYNPQGDDLQQNGRRRRRPKKRPLKLSYNFRYLFNDRTYQKYKTILNEAAQLVSEHRLDEALEYYYVIRDQNIPEAFRMMIEENIKEITRTMIETFRFSDTIVQVKDTGKITKLRTEFQNQASSG